MNNIVNSRVVVNKDSIYNSKPLPYKMNDLASVYTHYDPVTGKNIATENKLNGGNINNGKSSK